MFLQMEKTFVFYSIVLGLLSFYKVITFIYFITGSLYGQRLWQTISKGGPMHQVCYVISCFHVVQLYTAVIIAQLFNFPGY
jgi:hypothetical protein